MIKSPLLRQGASHLFTLFEVIYEVLWGNVLEELMRLQNIIVGNGRQTLKAFHVLGDIYFRSVSDI